VYHNWYLKDGAFDAQGVLQGYFDKCDQAGRHFDPAAARAFLKLRQLDGL
jgi:hypothetical protein